MTEKPDIADRRLTVARLLMEVIITICVVILVPICGWALKEIVLMSSRISILETRVEQVNLKEIYSTRDAIKDHGVVMMLIDDMGKELTSVRTRLRTLERKSHIQ